MGNKIYKRLLSRSYQFYVNSRNLQKQHPAKNIWEKIKYYAARVADVILGPEISESQDEVDIAENKDACYYKVKSRYKVWPSAYASGALVQCRKKGAKNWGNKGKKQ